MINVAESNQSPETSLVGFLVPSRDEYKEKECVKGGVLTGTGKLPAGCSERAFNQKHMKAAQRELQ